VGNAEGFEGLDEGCLEGAPLGRLYQSKHNEIRFRVEIEFKTVGRPVGAIVGCEEGPTGLIEGCPLGCVLGVSDGCDVGLVGTAI